MNLSLRYSILSGLFSILFIPLIVSAGMFFPFITGKNFTFRIIVEIIFFLWIILALRDANYRPKFSWILASMAAFIGVIAIADIFGENPLKSFWSNYERMEGLVTLLHLLAYFLVLGSMLQTAVSWRRFFQTSLFVSFIVCIYSFIQLSGHLPINQGGVRVDATFGNATYLAIYMVFHMFMALFLMLQRDNKTFSKIVYGILIVMQGIVLYHTATRGAILGLIGGLLLTALIIAIFEKERRGLKKVSIGIIAAIFILTGIFFSVRNAQFIQNSPVLTRFANISWSETKTQARAYVWPMAIKGFIDHPIFGWGQENFNYVFNKYYDPRMYSQEPWFDRAHNTLLDWLIAGGLLGLLGYLALYFFGLYSIWKKGELSLSERAVLTGLFAAYLFNNLFVFDNITSYIMFIVFLAYFHFDTAKEFSGAVAKRLSFIVSDQNIVNRFIAPAVVILMIFSIYFFNAKAIAANTTLIQAISNTQNKNIVATMNGFKKAISYNTFGNQEIREQLMQAALTVKNVQGVNQSDVGALFNLAKEEYQKMILQVPNDARHHLFLGSLYDIYGFYGDGLKELQKAQEESPKKQTILFEIGSNLEAVGKYSDALAMFKEAYELAPDYDQARLLYAAASIYSGDDNLARDLLMPVFGTIAYPDDSLLKAYYYTKQYGIVAETWENYVKSHPNEARGHIALAASYMQLGRQGDSLKEVLKAKDLEADANIKASYDNAAQKIKAGGNPFQ